MKKKLLIGSLLTFSVILTIVYFSSNLIVGEAVVQNHNGPGDWAPDYKYYEVILDDYLQERSCEIKI